jgi:hypothetical protein
MREGAVGKKGINERQSVMKNEIRKIDSDVNFNRYFPLNNLYTSKIKQNKENSEFGNL